MPIRDWKPCQKVTHIWMAFHFLSTWYKPLNIAIHDANSDEFEIWIVKLSLIIFMSVLLRNDFGQRILAAMKSGRLQAVDASSPLEFIGRKKRTRTSDRITNKSWKTWKYFMWARWDIKLHEIIIWQEWQEECDEYMDIARRTL